MAKEKQLCEALIHADLEEAVIDLLKAAGYWDDPRCWRYYGDNELNWSQAGGQQGRADFALNEKVINSIDAVLTRRCIEAGIDPQSTDAPQTIRAAVSQFIEKSDPNHTASGRVEDWSPQFRTKVAENISVFTTEADGSKSGTKPSVNIADLGEGHTPEAFPHTFVGLARRNKASVQFVQGKFCQGGSGAIRHCGDHKLQLVVSRRADVLVASPVGLASYPKDSSDHQWGFTVVRRETATANSKVPVLTYLAPVGAEEAPRKGGVLRFDAAEMPLFPKGDKPYQRYVPSGSLIKLYSYQLKSTGNIIRRDGLLSKLDLLLPDPALPVRVHECRKRAHGEGEKGASEQSTTMAGLFARLANSDNLEKAPPVTMKMMVHGREVLARVFAFKANKGATYRGNEGVIFTVNGQAHANIKASIFARKRVGLQRLAKDLLVVVDCSTLDANERDDLFMSSRDRVAEESQLYTELERSLEDALREHQGLRELRNRRAQEDIAEQLGDNKPLEAVLKQVLKTSPALAALFGRGDRLSTPFKPTKVNEEKKPPALHQHPTFFHFSGKEPNSPLARTAHLEQKCRIALTTDAEDEYFTRKYDRGLLRFDMLGPKAAMPVETYIGPNLVDGRANVSFDLPLDTKVGDQLAYEIVVEDPVTLVTFKNQLTLLVGAAQTEKQGTQGKKAQPPGTDPGNNPDGKGGIALPVVIKLKKSNPKWQEHFSSDHDCLDLIEDVETANGQSVVSYTFYLNEDNRALQTELKFAKASAEVFLKQFEVGMVLVGLALIHHHQQVTANLPADASEEKEGEATLRERAKFFTRALAPVLLPMIESLGALNSEDLDSNELTAALEASS